MKRSIDQSFYKNHQSSSTSMHTTITTWEAKRVGAWLKGKRKNRGMELRLQVTTCGGAKNMGTEGSGEKKHKNGSKFVATETAWSEAKRRKTSESEETEYVTYRIAMLCFCVSVSWPLFLVVAGNASMVRCCAPQPLPSMGVWVWEREREREMVQVSNGEAFTSAS